MTYNSNTKMEHSRKASDEGWRMLAVSVLVVLILGLGSLVFDMGVLFRVVFTLIILFIGGVVVSYSIRNIRDEGTFLCQLTDEEFFQSIPVSGSGDSYRISLSEIIQIEIHDGGGEGPCDEWYVHTGDGRYRISANYGNPHRKFGEALQKALPEVKTITTIWRE